MTSSSTAVSLAITSSLFRSSSVTRATVQLTPSSVHSSLDSSAYDIVKPMSSMRSTGPAKSHGLFINNGSHGVAQTKLPHSGVITTESISFVATARTTSRTNDVSKSSIVSRPSLYVLPSQLTTSSKLSKLQTTETAKGTLRSVHRTPMFSETSTSSSQAGSSTLTSTPLVVTRCATENEVTMQTSETSSIEMPSVQLDSTLGLQNLASFSRLSSSLSASSSKAGVPTVSSTLHTTEKDITDQPTETARMKISSTRINSTLRLQHRMSMPQLGSPSRASSSQTDMPTLMSTSTIWLLCTTTEEITTEPPEMKKSTIPLAFESTIRASRSSLGLEYETSSSQEIINPSSSSPHTVAPILISTSSVRLRCEDATAPPTVEPEETSAIPGVMVQFQPVKEDQELVRTQRSYIWCQQSPNSFNNNRQYLVIFV